MSFLAMTRIGSLRLLEYVGGMATANLGPMNVDWEKIDKATEYHGGAPWWGGLTGHYVKHGPIIPSSCGEHVLPGKLKKIQCSRVVVAHAFNPSTREAEAGGFLWVRGQPGLKSKFQGRLQSYTEKPCLGEGGMQKNKLFFKRTGPSRIPL